MKRLCLGLSLLLLVCGLQAQETRKPVVHVFVPSNVRPHAMQELLDRSCGEKLEVKVFGRISEFRVQVITETDPPDAVITLGPIFSMPGMETYVPILRAKRKGADEVAAIVDERIVLLSVKEPIELKQIDNPAFGIVNLLGRRMMQQYVAEKLKAEGAVFDEKALRIRSVSKLEDLLSLLQFQNVVGILVPESKIEYYQSRSRLKLVETELKTFQISLPILAVREPGSELAALIKQQIENMEEDGKSVLGVDEWFDP